MGAWRTPPEQEAPSLATMEEHLRQAGGQPRRWSNQPGDTYDSHEHGYHKVLFCVRGSIVFHTPDGDIQLRAGDRLDVEPRTPHSATVGDEGVECVEAAV